MNSWIIKFEDEVIDCFDTEVEAYKSLKSDKVIDSFGFNVTNRCDVEEVEMEADDFQVEICSKCRLFLDGCCEESLD